jgi:hypothetical protein
MPVAEIVMEKMQIAADDRCVYLKPNEEEEETPRHGSRLANDLPLRS